MLDFLLEIGTEEIPDWMIEPALVDLRDKFQAAFGVFGGSAIVVDATPRRLVLLAQGLLARAADSENVVLGPYLSAGVKAAEGFARKCNCAVEQLAKTTDAKGERYVFHQSAKGQDTKDALADKLPAIIANLQFPKTMSWPGSQGVRFIRPIRWIVALLDDAVVPFTVGDVKSGNTTRGHRVLGSKSPVPLSIANYETILRQNGVIVKAEERRERIASQLTADVQSDEELLKTLVYLTEHPSVIRGSFDPAYLQLPSEILSTVMRHHQRYFSVVSPDGSLKPEFVAVTNTDGDPDGLIRQGNERVLRARFNDARFFWEVDQRRSLADRVPDLAKVTFHAKLGSYGEKTERVVRLAKQLAGQTNANATVVERACLLAKCDLTTDMVKEFTELQGVVGGLYARSQGEDAGVGTAIYDQYKPISMEDSIPRTLEGQIVSIADKLDTLRECFRVRMIPTGSKDPFALRRAAQGIVKILFEARLPIALLNLVADVHELAAFLKERIQYYLREVRGYAYDEVNAVLSAGVSTLYDAADRIEAIHYIRPTEDFEPVAASFKRIKNILKQAQLAGVPELQPELLTAGPEKDLYQTFLTVRNKVQDTKNYRGKLEAMASLRPQVDLFFDKILVNDPDQAIKRNRLALLHGLLTEFSNIADFSEIVTQGGM
jgi:glycyl-tRNA synthetase beta chain